MTEPEGFRGTKGEYTFGQKYGYGDSFCIFAPSFGEKAMFVAHRHSDYYVDYPASPNGGKILSTEAAREAGNYVPTAERKAEILAEEEATATLFAASKDLLAALQGLLAALETVKGFSLNPASPSVEQARAAIARALEVKS